MCKTKGMYYVVWAFLLVGLIACNNTEKPGHRLSKSNSHMAVPGTSEYDINGTKIVYIRDSEGCANKCQFLNDPEQCGDNKECQEYAVDAEKEYVDCLSPKADPEIAGERIKWAGSTTGVPQVCDEFTIVTHGSPGWAWSLVGGHYELACIGYYYAPMQLCCDQSSCVPKP